LLGLTERDELVFLPGCRWGLHKCMTENNSSHTTVS
jgi:hypothetical protein